MAVIRDLIEQERAALPVHQQDSAPAIVHGCLRMTPWLYEHHFDAHQTVMGAGFNQIVRAALKKPHGKITKEQLELWDEATREHLKTGGHSALFVPSRGQFVPVIPGMISRAELDEGGQYLIAVGFETVRRGQAYRRAAAV